MEFVVKKSELLKELQLCNAIVEKRNTIPILANVLLNAHGSTLEMVSTDLEVGLRTRCPAEVSAEGTVTLQGRKLVEIISSLPDSEIHFHLQDNSWVEVRCERSRFRMVGLSAADYPKVPETAGSRALAFPAAVLRELIHKVDFSIGGEDMRLPISGCLMQLDAESIVLVSTDGHRLAHVRQQCEIGGLEEPIRAIVPRKTLHELGRMNDEGDVRFSEHDNHLFFELGERLLFSTVTEGAFPDFDAVLPKGNDTSVTVSPKELGDALRRVSLLSNERSKAVRLKVGDDGLELSSSNPELGEARETCAAEHDGAELEIGFNARYLLDFLGAAQTDTVTCLLKDEQTQALLQPSEQKEGQEYRYVVMPMRI